MIEADRATEWHAAFTEKVRRYIDVYLRDDWRASLDMWPLILTITTSDVRVHSLAALAERVTLSEGGARITGSFRFAALDDLRTAGPFAPIWSVGGRSERLALLAPHARRDTERP